jgi:hypothetical protein
MKDRVKWKVENAESVWLPLAYRLRGVQGSHWLTECGVCRAPISSKNAGSAGRPIGTLHAENAGIPLAQKNAGSAGLLFAQRMREVQGAHWHTQNAQNAGLPLAPIGSQKAGLPLAYRLRGVHGSHWLTEYREGRVPIGLQTVGSAGLYSCVNGAQAKSNSIWTISVFYHTTV